MKLFAAASLIALSSAAFAAPKATVTVLNGDPATAQKVRDLIDVDSYRNVKVQTIYNDAGKPDHLLVHLFAKGYHRVTFAAIDVSGLEGLGLISNYQLTARDFAQQPGHELESAGCPDTSIEFIAICPNDDDLELKITKEVAEAARAKHLKTIELLVEDATTAAYTNYMKCPKLRGNFYDGDADPEVITTYDGVLSAHDITNNLQGSFHHSVTNIWLACQAFNDPMKSTMIDTAQSRKYAAGINDLLVGPSDEAAACAMKAALDGKPLTASFWKCYDELDNAEDHWGFEGTGTDLFWD